MIRREDVGGSKGSRGFVLGCVPVADRVLALFERSAVRSGWNMLVEQCLDESAIQAAVLETVV